MRLPFAIAIILVINRYYLNTTANVDRNISYSAFLLSMRFLIRLNEGFLIPR
jgi:hypothetical protein